MRFGFLRFIQLLCVGMLTVIASSDHPIAQTTNQASAQNGQPSDQAKTQEVRPPRALPPEPLNKKEVVYSRHDNVIPSLAFSPDGKRLASAGDNCVKITDLENGKELLKMQTIADATSHKSGKNAMPPVSWLNAIIFSRDGRQVIGGSGDSIIRYYDSESV